LRKSTPKRFLKTEEIFEEKILDKLEKKLYRKNLTRQNNERKFLKT
jgi:hypothetical protein